MDKTSIIGIVVGVAAVLLAMIFKGTSLLVLFNLPAIFIIFVGTIAAVLIAFPSNEIKRIPSLFKVLFTEQKNRSMTEIIETFVNLSTTARKEGILALENEVSSIDDPFFKQGIGMAIDGLDAEFIKDTLEKEIAAMEERHLSGAAIFSQAGTYAPTLGVLGAVLGLIAALGNLNDIEVLGGAIAAAFVATLFGIFTGYVLWHPFANKLKRKSQQEVLEKTLIVEGILSLQAGLAPRALEEKLQVFMARNEREKISTVEGEQ